jgi:hypothetical protein
MLILEVLLQLTSKQGDVTAAFLHADLDKEKEKVYVEMPLGFRSKGKVLKLIRRRCMVFGRVPVHFGSS